MDLAYPIHLHHCLKRAFLWPPKQARRHSFASIISILRQERRSVMSSLALPVILLDWSGVDLNSNPLHPLNLRFGSRSSTALQYHDVLFIVSLGKIWVLAAAAEDVFIYQINVKFENLLYLNPRLMYYLPRRCWCCPQSQQILHPSLPAKYHQPHVPLQSLPPPLVHVELLAPWVTAAETEAPLPPLQPPHHQMYPSEAPRTNAEDIH